MNATETTHTSWDAALASAANQAPDAEWTIRNVFGRYILTTTPAEGYPATLRPGPITHPRKAALAAEVLKDHGLLMIMTEAHATYAPGHHRAYAVTAYITEPADREAINKSAAAAGMSINWRTEDLRSDLTKDLEDVAYLETI